MNHLRLEKGIPLFGKDFTKDHSAIEIDLVPRFVKVDKEADFVGKKAIQEQLKTGLNCAGDPLRKFVMLEVKDTEDADCVGNEPIFSGDKCIGFTTSGAWGFNVNKSIAVGYVAPEFASKDAKLSVELLGKRLEAVIHEEPFMKTWGQRQKAAKAA